MTMIGPAISELLPGHECVIVPGLGGFITAFAPARIDENIHRFSPPCKSVAFNASLSNNDGILANHIAGKYNISYTEALYKINEWSQNTKQILKNGGEIVIERIGKLSVNIAGNLYFEPDAEVNYYSGSYGLPVFESAAVQSPEDEYEVISSTGKVKHNIRHLIPATLKWAAILVPLIGFTIWGSMNTPPIGNFINNQSGLLAWSNSTPGKTAVMPAGQIAEPTQEVKITSPDEALGENATALMPGVISYTEMHSQNISIEQPLPENNNLPEISIKPTYHIVAGAFREISNANRLVARLQSEGYPATIADTNKRGLFVVSICSFASRHEAFAELKNIRSNGHPSAWVFKNR
jgi:hypothetical protein